MRVNSEALIAGGAAAALVSALYARYGKKFLIDFIAGGVAGAVAKTLTAPIESCKQALQIQEIHPDVKSGAIQRYDGIVDYFVRTYNEKGLLAFWEGNTVNVLRYFPTQMVNFTFKDSIKKMFPKYNSKTQFWKFFASNMASGGVAGAISLSVVYPLDYIRTIQQYDFSGKYKDQSILTIGRGIVRKRGLLALYSGFGISVLGIVLYRGPYFGLFDFLKSANPFKADKGYLGLASKFAIAQTTAIFAGFISFPFDTIRRRMVMDVAFATRDGEEPRYQSPWHALVTIVKDEGVLALFQGFGANVLRTLAGAMILVGYDVFKRSLLIKKK